MSGQLPVEVTAAWLSGGIASCQTVQFAHD
ncbi:hypothetical protein BH24ACT5_BH24ACT5_12460 [soil metagenome]